ncbi:hypothetical protein GALL_341290 [mine drainage metagenome]|uniref:Uncharacterized protein n=1 Tax=mine drainage metagenome TaxID=410659 RepID=A0A1J5QKJ0_9ZZZZ
MTSMTERAPLPTHLTALCCECGTPRSVTFKFAGAVGDCRLKCATCKTTTTHAPVRPEGWDYRESINRKITPNLEGDDAKSVVYAAVEQLETCDVRVEWEDRHGDSLVAWLERYLDDGVYFITLNENASPGLLLDALDRIWSAMATNPGRWHVVPQEDDEPARAWIGYYRK